MARLALLFAGATVGFLVLNRLGLGLLGALVVLLGIILGGAIELPLPVGRRLAGRSPRVVLNVGGGLIPLVLAGFLALKLPATERFPFGGSVALVSAASFGLARPEPGRGIVLPWIFPALLAAALAIFSGSSRPGPFAFASAVFATFLGADVLHLRSLRKIGALRAGLGGGGWGDGILWSGVLAAALAGGL